MAAKIAEIKRAFVVLCKHMVRKEFRKTFGFDDFSERELLVHIRFFLLGWFGSVEPEIQAKLHGSKTKFGRIDFQISGCAIEVAVRRKNDPRGKLHRNTNETEVKKLATVKCRSVLVLLDFSYDSLSSDKIQEYRLLPQKSAREIADIRTM